MDFKAIVLSHATYVGPSGATAAATYAFATKDYKPPSTDRTIETDIVINQNGKFKYVYDNGPGFATWAPFEIHCEEAFKTILNANAAQQFAHLKEFWDHPGNLGMSAPEGTYLIHWAQSPFEKSFRVFPKVASQVQEFIAVVQFEESQ